MHLVSLVVAVGIVLLSRNHCIAGPRTKTGDLLMGLFHLYLVDLLHFNISYENSGSVLNFEFCSLLTTAGLDPLEIWIFQYLFS